MILKPEHTPYHRVFGPVRWVLSNREVEGRSGGRCRGVGDAYARRRSVARTACWSLRSGVSPLKKCQRYVKPCVEHGGGHQLSRSRLTCNKQAIDGSTGVVEPQRQHHSRHIFQSRVLGGGGFLKQVISQSTPVAEAPPLFASVGAGQSERNVNRSRFVLEGGAANAAAPHLCIPPSRVNLVRLSRTVHIWTLYWSQYMYFD